MNKYTNYISKTLNTLYYYICYRGTGIVMNSWNHLRFGRIRHRNFGDELNYYILRELTGKPISNLIDICKWGFKGKEDILFIGSLVEDFTTHNTIIWGSGALFGGDRPLRNKPKEVRAVRGKLTRDYLLKNGVDCPEVYGDPALLCPKIYQPKVGKKYKVGIIPHIDDLDHPTVKQLEKQGAHIICLSGYRHWQDVLDEICLCEKIVSSSLHGLILSDAYQIPNLWVTFKDQLLGGHFKFFDYFSGVDRLVKNPISLKDQVDLDVLIEKCNDYKPIEWDPESFLRVAPISLRHE